MVLLDVGPETVAVADLLLLSVELATEVVALEYPVVEAPMAVERGMEEVMKLLTVDRGMEEVMKLLTVDRGMEEVMKLLTVDRGIEEVMELLVVGQMVVVVVKVSVVCTCVSLVRMLFREELGYQDMFRKLNE